MGALIHFDVAAVFVLSIILFTNIYRNMSKGTTNRMFLLLISAALLAAAFEIALIFMYAAGCTSDTAFTIIKSCYMIAHNTASPLYFLYIISLAKTWHKIKDNPLITAMLTLPYAALIICILLNLFTGFMFEYSGGEMIKYNVWIVYLCAAVYIVSSVVYLIIRARLFKRHQILALASMVPLSVAAVLVKQFYPNSLVEIFSNAVGIMIMSMVIQRPEEMIDSFTQLKKYSAYADDMKKNFINNNHVTVILVNIANYNSLHNILGYDDTNLLLRRLGNKINDANERVKAHADVYYLDRGRFRIIVNSFYRRKVSAMATSVAKLFSDRITANKIDLNLDSYICVARCPEDIPDFKALIAFGTDFHEKMSNYDGTPIYAEEIFKQKNFSMNNEINTIIDRALTQNNLKVYYQPIYSVEEQRFTSAEALLRLIDDVHGFVPPDIFITAAEKSGAIHKIGSFVLNEVCRFIASDDYKKLGLDYIEINLSVAQCMRGGLADEVLTTLEKYGVKPSQINLEITETAASYNQNTMAENLAKLSDAGVSFSLDDFGTGYSNIDRVASLPLKIVKLDRTFVNNNEQPKMEVFVENFIRMFKDMDMEIVVEGIETEQMVKRFSELRCDFIQGYYYSKPIPEKDFVEFIMNNAKSA